MFRKPRQPQPTRPLPKKLYRLKFKVEIEALKEKIRKEYVIEISDGEEFSGKLAKIQREWINETGILDFTTTIVLIEGNEKSLVILF